ncbi:MAG: TrkA C-terminal domain-containing protein [Calditrichaceae bacterium]
MFRSLSKNNLSISDLKSYIGDIDINTIKIDPKSRIAGKSIREINLRKQFGISIVAIRREARIIANPEPETILLAEDVLYVLGAPANISETVKQFTKTH